MKNLVFILAIILLHLSSCEKIEEGECNIYKIPKRNHPAEERNSFFQNSDSRIEFSFIINETMFYDVSEIPNFKNGHNKIRGLVCISELNIKEYSARITWRCDTIEGKAILDLGYLVHLPTIENHIQGFLLKNVKEGDHIYAVVEDLGKEGFYLSAENLTTGRFLDIVVDKKGAGNVKSHKIIDAPYFGGQEKAPHNIFIEICTEL